MSDEAEGNRNIRCKWWAASTASGETNPKVGDPRAETLSDPSIPDCKEWDPAARRCLRFPAACEVRPRITRSFRLRGWGEGERASDLNGHHHQRPISLVSRSVGLFEVRKGLGVLESDIRSCSILRPPLLCSPTRPCKIFASSANLKDIRHGGRW